MTLPSLVPFVETELIWIMIFPLCVPRKTLSAAAITMNPPGSVIILPLFVTYLPSSATPWLPFKFWLLLTIPPTAPVPAANWYLPAIKSGFWGSKFKISRLEATNWFTFITEFEPKYTPAGFTRKTLPLDNNEPLNCVAGPEIRFNTAASIPGWLNVTVWPTLVSKLFQLSTAPFAVLRVALPSEPQVAELSPDELSRFPEFNAKTVVVLKSRQYVRKYITPFLK